MQVLLVDDDTRGRNSLIKALHKAGYEVVSFESVPPALEYILCHHIDAALIDYLLPGPNGLMLAERLRIMRPDCPIVLVSHYAQLDHLEKGFQIDIDDFVIRPVKHSILLDRLALAMVRRAESFARRSRPQLDFLELDTAKRIVRWFGKPLRLTPKEMQLLACLTTDPGRYFTYSDLYAMMYGERLSVTEASYKLRALLNRLRNKLETQGTPRVIEGERGLGFRWNQSVLEEFCHSHAQRPPIPD